MLLMQPNVHCCWTGRDIYIGWCFVFDSYVKAIPVWGMQLTSALAAGRHHVTYYTWSPVNNGSASCHLTIHVHGIRSIDDV